MTNELLHALEKGEGAELISHQGPWSSAWLEAHD